MKLGNDVANFYRKIGRKGGRVIRHRSGCSGAGGHGFEPCMTTVNHGESCLLSQHLYE